MFNHLFRAVAVNLVSHTVQSGYKAVKSLVTEEGCKTPQKARVYSEAEKRKMEVFYYCQRSIQDSHDRVEERFRKACWVCWIISVVSLFGLFTYQTGRSLAIWIGTVAVWLLVCAAGQVWDHQHYLAHRNDPKSWEEI